MSKGYSEAHVVAAVKECEAGADVDNVCVKFKISQKTFFRWRRKYTGLDIIGVKKIRALELENHRLKKLIVEKMLENEQMKEALAKDKEYLSSPMTI